MSRVALVAVLVACAAVASAQPADEAEREYQLGYAALQAGDCAEALVHYHRSFDATPRPRTLFNMAACQEELGLQADAWHNYRAFLELAEARDAKIVVKAEARVAALREVLRGNVTIETTPAGASVQLDGDPAARGVTPLTLALAPGTHTILISIADAAPVERTIEVAPDETELVAVTLAVSVAIAPPEVPLVPAPTVTPIEAREVVVTPVDVAAPRPSSRARGVLGWSLGVLGVASLVGGAAVGVLALRDVADPTLDDRARGESRAWIADGLFVAGAVAIVTAWRLLRDGGR